VRAAGAGARALSGARRRPSLPSACATFLNAALSCRSLLPALLRCACAWRSRARTTKRAAHMRTPTALKYFYYYSPSWTPRAVLSCRALRHALRGSAQVSDVLLCSSGTAKHSGAAA
jgi:hypothetical protein